MKANFTIYTFLILVLFLTSIERVKSLNTFQHNINSVSVIKSGNSCRDNSIELAFSGLPVKYLSFEARTVNELVNLNWVTTGELSNSHFEIERSFDKTNFKTIALMLDGFNDAGQNKTYQYKDHATENKGRGIIYYRLKQIDLEGYVNYSNIIAVKFENKAEMAIAQ